MDIAKLWFWFTLLCVCGSWISSLAINCDWTTEYELGKKCFKACPSGEYPKESWQENSGIVCEKCPPNPALGKVKCFCNNDLCLNEDCSSCEKRISCEPGHKMRRRGDFDYNYICEPACPKNTYYDAEGSTCKSIIQCVGDVIPGNKTHNARCVSSDKQENGILSHPFMVACLIVTVLTCFVFIMYIAFQIFKYKMLIKLRKPCTHVLPSDTCSCKLSKEEMGDGSDSVSEEYSKCDVNSFP
ncbi:tumor necrosis factor receptor superfamily member 18 [Rhinichthys klamathensis goyatoka]|uniref:tumor necrosis factor receptor superfamily member 18 n=1 Tax=Rhinichthys klamathensis goyatoka TaxID=3034132 RepID=UPI0024B59280|nr:tumor necrosis factor receptor superfamily member 18 [Rhinichthys klamathensis goyatoka]XP_056109710.1 tumor necrosis factor receptor superfamily member 18 [Rhinichthys klamathensis goyatoka]